jgi:hypothetical protein
MYWTECGRIQPWPRLRNYPDTHLEGPRKTTKTCHNSRSLSSKLGNIGIWSCEAHDLMPPEGYGVQDVGKQVDMWSQIIMAADRNIFKLRQAAGCCYCNLYLCVPWLQKEMACCMRCNPGGKQCVHIQFRVVWGSSMSNYFSDQHDQNHDGGILYLWYKLLCSQNTFHVIRLKLKPVCVRSNIFMAVKIMISHKECDATKTGKNIIEECYLPLQG